MPDGDYVAEMSRLGSLDEATRLQYRQYDKELSECKTFVDQLRADLKKKKEREGSKVTRKLWREGGGLVEDAPRREEVGERRREGVGAVDAEGPCGVDEPARGIARCHPGTSRHDLWLS